MSISLSVVSHGHGQQILDLFESMVSSGWAARFGCIEVVLTLNLPEDCLKEKILGADFPFELIILENPKPLGFSENHNRAFSRASGKVFAVVNPDITFLGQFDLPFDFGDLNRDGHVGVWVPCQLNSSGGIQDYRRNLITPWEVFRRALARHARLRLFLDVVEDLDDADWVNGAFLLFPRDVYQNLHGFDEKYHMYCEDVDFCLRLRLNGFRIVPAPFSVLHAAHRKSSWDIRHFCWHIASLFRLWTSPIFWRYWRHSFSGN